MTAPVQPEASRSALALATVAEALDETQGRQLARLLSMSMTTTTPPQRRRQRLGLIIAMLDNNAEIPSSPQYDAEHGQRALRGEEWPARRSITPDAFPTWLAAVKAAMHIWHGRHRGISDSKRPNWPNEPYTEAEFTDAFQRCHAFLQDWPTPREYATWAELVRKHAHIRGLSNPRLPTAKQIRSHGGFPTLLDTARRVT